MSRKPQKRPTAQERAPAIHHMIAMSIPPRDSQYRVSPFTATVIAMPVNECRALVFNRQRESVPQMAGKVGAAIKAAQRRDPDKQFIKRRIVHHGRETYAIWRVK